MKTLIGVALAVAATVASAAPAQATDFCNGFAEGYRSVKGDAASIPACPQERGVPPGSSSFREGVKAGIQAGRKK